MAQGHDCSFVHPLSRDLQSECSICLNVLREPCLVSCCGHRFCRACLEPIERKRGGSKRCPLCNSGDFTSLPDKQLERTLNDKMVYCVNKSDGCKWKGKRVDLDNHLLGSCTFNVVSCPYCKSQQDTLPRLEFHHYGECPMYPVVCPHGCGSKVLRRNIARHVDESCPKVVVDCAYKFAGCQVRLPRRDMKGHEDSEEHLALAALKISELKEENSHLKKVAQVGRPPPIAQSHIIRPVSISSTGQSNHRVGSGGQMPQSHLHTRPVCQIRSGDQTPRKAQPHRTSQPVCGSANSRSGGDQPSRKPQNHHKRSVSASDCPSRSQSKKPGDHTTRKTQPHVSEKRGTSLKMQSSKCHVKSGGPDQTPKKGSFKGGGIGHPPHAKEETVTCVIKRGRSTSTVEIDLSAKVKFTNQDSARQHSKKRSSFPK